MENNSNIKREFLAMTCDCCHGTDDELYDFFHRIYTALTFVTLCDCVFVHLLEYFSLSKTRGQKKERIYKYI